jgi:hypothetical protein
MVFRLEGGMYHDGYVQLLAHRHQVVNVVTDLQIDKDVPLRGRRIMNERRVPHRSRARGALLSAGSASFRSCL